MFFVDRFAPLLVASLLVGRSATALLLLLIVASRSLILFLPPGTSTFQTTPEDR